MNTSLLVWIILAPLLGAIMTLILFILMFLNIKEKDLPKEPNKYKFMIIGAFIMIPLNILVLKAVAKLPAKDLTISDTEFGNIKPLGMELYNNWIIPFELISILLLIALIGSVVLAKKRKSKLNDKGEQL